MINKKNNHEKIEGAENTKNTKLVKWFKRLGWAGFLFFTIKGLVWLAVIFGVGSLFSC